MARQFLHLRRARARHSVPRLLPLLSLETTLRCNANCLTCGYPSHYPDDGQAELSSGELERLIGQAAELGVLMVSLGGGEPFMRDDTEALIGHLNRHRVVPLVHSNGSLLTPERCKRLAAQRQLVLSLSLDSHRRQQHDQLRQLVSFDRICASARWFARHAPQVRVVLMVTVSRHNLDCMLPIMQLARDIGVTSVRFTPAHSNLQHRHDPALVDTLAPTPAALAALPAQIEAVLRFARRQRMVTNSAAFLRRFPAFFAGGVKQRCYAGYLFYSIDPFGNLFPCYDQQGELNIRQFAHLRDAIASDAMQQLRAQVRHCQTPCWNVGCAEPSLRMDLRQQLELAPQLLREMGYFLR